MIETQRYASDYLPAHVERVRTTCLEVATRLGDYMEEIVVVGGLIPSLLIDSSSLPKETQPHVGTTDLDIGLKVAILNNERYRGFTERLRQAGFEQDLNERGQPTRQRWKTGRDGRNITIDFLISPVSSEDEAGRLLDIEPDFAAIVTPGLNLAFEDRIRVELSGKTLHGAWTTRNVWVCGPGAYIVLKALAFRNRGKEKDAYDLYYIARNFGAGVEQVRGHLEKLPAVLEKEKALKILKEEFLAHDGLGPISVAQFLTRSNDDVIQADVAGFIARLLAFQEKDLIPRL